MGKTKIKTIDDFAEVEVSQKPRAAGIASGDARQAKRAQKDKTDSLVEKLKAELGVEVKEVEGQKSKVKTTIQKPKDEKSTEETPKQKVQARSQKYQQAASEVDKSKLYPLKDAVELAQKTSYSQFPGTLEIHINTAAKNIRGLLTLPHAAGKKLAVLAFGPTSLEELRGVDTAGLILGTEETIEEISQGRVNFDVVVTTPGWMPKLAKVARVLGPRGLMPNPKNGTITQDLKKTVAELQAGKVEYKTEPNGQVIHLAVGKVSQPVEEIAANLKLLYQTIGRSRIKKMTLSPTMGPGVKIDLGSV